MKGVFKNEAEVAEYMAEYNRKMKKQSWLGVRGEDIITESPYKPDEGPESRLQGKIMKYAKDHGFPCQCFRRSIKAKKFLVPGWPD